MHIPNAEGKILSLKVLAQKGFKSHILSDQIQITKDNKTYTKALLGGELYEAKMRVIPPQENILSAVKRDTPAADLHTWHWRPGHLGDSILKGLVGSSSVKGMDVTSTQLMGIGGDCVIGNMNERPFEDRAEHDSQLFRTLHADLIGLMNPEAQWSHARFSLIVHDDCSTFGFTFHLTHKDHALKALIDLDKSIENKFQKQMHTLKTDNGGEFINAELQKQMHT